MKVVLFCGGQGTRMRDYSESIPKPMINLGYRPILWHIMKYYAFFGHKDFILCLGYKADMIKRYFLNYEESLSNDFVLTKGGKELQLLSSDIDDWKITFVDTGLQANIGQRLKAVEPYLQSEETFLANYSDGLSNLHLPTFLDHFKRNNKTASFLSVRPNQSYHLVSMNDDGLVKSITGVRQRSDVWINGGFFAFKREIFDYINPGEELVLEPFQRLIDRQQLVTYCFNDFWASMDTFKDKQQLDDLTSQGVAPWELWRLPKEEKIVEELDIANSSL